MISKDLGLIYVLKCPALHRSKIEKKTRGIQIEKSRKNTTSSGKLVSTIGAYGCLVGCFDDLRRFSDLSAISQLGSRR